MDSLDLVPDADCRRHVGAEWQKLMAAGLPSQARHTGSSNLPHITLAAAPSINASSDENFARLAGQLPFPLVLDGMLVFRGRKGRYVLARHVLCSPELLEFQRETHALLPASADPTAPTRPGGWVPHLTLARNLDAEQLATALALLRPEALEATAVMLRRWDNGHKVVLDFPFSAGP